MKEQFLECILGCVLIFMFGFFIACCITQYNLSQAQDTFCSRTYKDAERFSKCSNSNFAIWLKNNYTGGQR